MQSITERLKRIGFTEYESKVYITLLASHPANGNEIANLSGVPGAKVYSCLQGMTEKGYVSVIYEEGIAKPKVKYMATPYEQILNNHLKNVSQDIKFLKKELKRINDKRPENTIKQELYQIFDNDMTFNTIKDLINSSQKSIYICYWQEHFKIIERDLIDAYERNVKIVSLSFDDSIKKPYWHQTIHLHADIVRDRHLYELNMVIDEKVIVISKLHENNTFTVVSDNLALVQTALNYIRHDIYINRMLHDFYDSAVHLYGSDLQGLINL